MKKVWTGQDRTVIGLKINLKHFAATALLVRLDVYLGWGVTMPTRIRTRPTIIHTDSMLQNQGGQGWWMVDEFYD